MSNILKIFLIIILLAQIYLILKTTKRKNLAMKYTSLWLIMVFIMLIIVIFPGSLISLSKLLGFEATSNMIFILAFFFLFYMLFIHTTSISRQKYQIVNLVQEISILKKELEYGKKD